MRIEKKQIVSQIGSILVDASFLYMIAYKGLKVKDFEQLRIQLEKAGAFCHVFKNTYIRKAAELNNLSELAKVKLTGDTALVGGKGDCSAIAKIISEFIKKFNVVGIKCGYLEGSVLQAADVDAISKLPAKEILYAQLLGVLQAPARNLVSVLNAKLASPVYVLSAFKDKKAESAS
ncbi:MAG TPA: 50S ribosomal protein L10 [Lentisphaeria bacterium]|nr:MAG: 50S ribosomal protein L10 [Lentisphaerae bacterium GWF2_38_69]HBM15468.1 50S ribosomal protein L10 [Lentisphaeria bacterium]